MGQLFGITVAFAVLSVVFFVTERLFSSMEERRWWRRGAVTDTVYWFFTPLVARPVTYAAIVVAAVAVAAPSGVPLEGDELRAFLERDTLAKQQPAALQAIEVFVLFDFITYWAHRWFHVSGALWPVHAVHHSSTDLDWLSSVRVHPLNEVGMRVAQATPLLALGFDPTVLAAWAPVITFYAIFIHANLPWDYGRLRYVIASPAFHRWHHTKEAEGVDKNFGGMLPAWDILFGTWFLPAGRPASRFGIAGDPVPQNVIGQLLHPFRRPKRAVEATM